MLENWGLIYALASREVVGRYKGSILGLAWSFFSPVLMLAIYTFVFSVVFKARWQGGSESKAEFALVLFTGLLFFNFFSECINRAPVLVLGNVNYVKKVVFPLETLAVVSMLSALFHLLVSLLVWLLFYLIVFGVPSWTALLFPLVLLPLIMFTLGLSWVLASLSVYLRDVGQVVGVVVTMLMFLSPIFYPIDALPEWFRPYMNANPLTWVIESGRDVLIWGQVPDLAGWMVAFALSALIMWFGHIWFNATKSGFADVI
ncbi:ABC transporter permease [Solilutibacter tolerans]|nr:ABC transporter permease [Lysobacter tolerans]